jgi:hypothetical protein
MNPFKFIREKVKKHGWKAVVGIFFYYLIRDLTLYVFIPYLLLSSG